MHLGLIGYGNIARSILEALGARPLDRLTVLVRSPAVDAARQSLTGCRAARHVDVVCDPATLTEAAPDLVVECAGQGAVGEIVPALVAAGTDTVVVSVGALAEDNLAEALRDAAARSGARMILPAGAIGGIDLLASIAPAGDVQVTYTGTKPPAAWVGTPAEAHVDLQALCAPVTFFEGSAREAAALGYPKNANVAATLALAGAGFDATRVALVADPSAQGNRHAYEVRSPICRYSVVIDNAASGGNAKTSVATVYSVLREINRTRATVVI